MEKSPFTTCSTLQSAKKLYRQLAMLHHPDHGGSEEVFKQLLNHFEDFCVRFMGDAYEQYRHERREAGQYAGDDFADLTPFSSILSELLRTDWDCTIEIIGYWIYVWCTRENVELHEYLKSQGFFFSGKHKAWIFSGMKKRKMYHTRLTTNDVRNRWGSHVVQEEGGKEGGKKRDEKEEVKAKLA